MAKHAELGVTGRDDWLLSFLLLIAGGVIVFLAEARNPHDIEEVDVDAPTPFLCRHATALIFAIILLVAGAVHQYVLGYLYDVRSVTGDYLPLVSIASLIALQLSFSLRYRSPLFEAGLASLPLAFCGYAVLSKDLSSVPLPGVHMIWHPPVLLGLTGVAVLWNWVRTRNPRLLAVCGAYLVGLILTVGFSTTNPLDLNWHLAGALLVSALMVLGLYRRNIPLCILTVVVATGGFIITDTFKHFAMDWNLTHPGAFVGFAGLGVLGLTLIFGRNMPRILAALGALGVMAFVFDLLPIQPTASDLIVFAGVLPICVAVWIRGRHWPSITILLIPLTYRLWSIFTRLTAWRFVILSFLLLFAGAWISARKGRNSEE